jgi:hypothetical protein
MSTPDRIRIGDSATTSVPIAWLNAHGYDAESYGCDGFGKPGRQGVVFSEDLDNPVVYPPRFALIGDVLEWNAEFEVLEHIKARNP